MLQNMAEDVETMSLEQADEHLDVKQLQLVHKQLRFAESLQAKQEYFLPMFLGEQLAGVHLTLQQRAGTAGAVEIRVNAGDMELEAHLQVKGRHHRWLSRRKYTGRGYEIREDLRYIP